MAQMLETVIQFFEENEWDFFKSDEEPILEIPFRGESGEWVCYAFANEEQHQFTFYSVCPVCAPEEKLQAVAELTTRINYGLVIGNFELDFEDGEIRFKTSIDVVGDRLSIALVERVVAANVAVMDIYMPAVMQVINSDVPPAQAAAHIENEIGCDCGHEH